MASSALRKRGVLTSGILLVPLHYLRNGLFQGNVLSLGYKFLETAPAPLIRRGRQKKFHFGIGKDHRADVAPFQNDAAMFTQFPLTLHQDVPDNFLCGDRRSQETDFRSPYGSRNILAVQHRYGSTRRSG